MGTATAATVTLFDDTAGTLPGLQSWLFYAALGGVASQAVLPGVGAGLTTDDAVAAGYSNTIPLINVIKNGAFPALDRATGFSLDFELQILGESHNNANRAGFSVVLLAESNLGIEIGFWEDEIWAQNDVFVHDEGVSFDTTAIKIQYSLAIHDAGYTLSANDTEILNGDLREDYSVSKPIAPYTLSNFLFLGDDTSNAQADIALGLVELRTLTAVPIPPAFVLFFAPFAATMIAFRRRRS